MDVQTQYVLVSGRTIANKSGQTRRISVQRGSGIIKRRIIILHVEAATLRLSRKPMPGGPAPSLAYI
jgi:hypothetical protein